MGNARKTVVTALMKQEQNGYANLVLQSVLAHHEEEASEKAFITAVFYGTVERMITIDYLLAQCLSRPLAKLDAAVRAILRAGVYQARWMNRVPVHAAINESVELTRKMKKTSAAGLVNAVLRRATAIDLKTLVFENKTQQLSVQYSVSLPIVQLLQKTLPLECEPFLAHSFTQNPLCIRVNTLQTTAAKLKETLPVLKQGSVQGSLYLEQKGDVTKSKAFKEGLFHVQGEASQFACAALNVKENETVLDLCAAPGGKSVTLAQQMKNNGVLICKDKAENRVPLIETALQRAGITCATVGVADASVYDETLPQADAVLCDVPCSGIGILAKKPDIRYKMLTQIDQLISLQQEIIATASRYIKKGGRLVYSTCTINPQENEFVVETFLKNHPQFSLQELPTPPQGAVIKNKMVTFYPHKTNLDGFFVALLRREG